MSEANRTRLEVQEILGGCIAQGLSSFGLTSWKVMEFANPSLNSADGVVLMNYLRSDRAGWNGSRTEIVDGNLTEFSSWCEVQHWQLHVIAKRTNATTDDSILSEDVTNDLAAWLNGFGTEYMRAHGLSNLRIDPSNILVYNDNSNLYQKRGVFTVKIVVQKEISRASDELSQIQPDIKPV